MLKIQVTVAINFISSKDNYEVGRTHSKVIRKKLLMAKQMKLLKNFLNHSLIVIKIRLKNQ